MCVFSFLTGRRYEKSDGNDQIAAYVFIELEVSVWKILGGVSSSLHISYMLVNVLKKLLS